VRRLQKKLSKRSFPLWVIIFSLIILAATVFSLVRLPSVVSTAVAFSRGEKAAKEKNYITAANEYKKVAEKYSNSTQILAKLFLAQYYNLQIDEAYDTFTIISGREEEDTELVEKVMKYLLKSRLVTILKATVSTLCCWNITTTPKHW